MIFGLLWGPEPLALNATTFLFLTAAVAVGTMMGHAAAHIGRLLAKVVQEEKKTS